MIGGLSALVVMGCLSAADAAPGKKKPKPPPPSDTTTTTAPTNTPPAADKADKARAADLFKKSADAYMKGDFAQAIKLLDEAYALDPQPVLVYNQARAHEGLGHLDEAITLYETYLQREPSSPDRGAIEQRVATLKKEKEDRERVEKEKADVAAQKAQQDEQQKALEQRERDAAQSPPRKRSVLPYVVGGVGVAGIATGSIFGILALGQQSKGNDANNLRDATSHRDTGKTFATVSNVGFIVGGVLLAGGVVWWILDGKAAKKTGALPPTLLTGTF